MVRIVGNRSFDCVDFKLAEADFFFEKLKAADFSELNFYFSAFVSASRSVSFALQAVMDGVEGFDHWYSNRQEEMRNDPVCRFFVAYRNETQKTGERAIYGGHSRLTPDGHRERKYRFGRSISTGERHDIATSLELVMRGMFERALSASDQDDALPTEPDAIELCRRYIVRIASLVSDCYRDFDYVVDPDVHYTVEGLRKAGKTVEDVEEEFGLPKGWTALAGNTDELRLRLLSQNAPRSAIKHLFQKYHAQST